MTLYDISTAQNMTFYNTTILPENMPHIGIGDIIKLKVGKKTNDEYNDSLCDCCYEEKLIDECNN